MSISLAVTYHDPVGGLIPLIGRVLPFLLDIFDGIAVRASSIANEDGLAYIEAAGGVVLRTDPADDSLGTRLGKARRQALELALGFGTPSILYCDCDRILHWGENYPAELIEVLRLLSKHDFTVIGRTERAYRSHPRAQRDTEAIVNHLFSLVTGQGWDVMAGTRGLSRLAAQSIIDGCRDEKISVDVSWPLYLREDDRYSLGYLATEGMEFETPDRYPQEVASAGGLSAWIDQIDSDLDYWLHRVNYIQMYAGAMEPYFYKRKNKELVSR